MPLPVTLKAPAKINLGLVVKGERPDGYHDIETILVAVSLYDQVTLEKIDQGIELVTFDRNVPRKKKNIVYKAADLFFKHSGIRAGVRIVLKKNIPLGAGLGGGSSDAAATLVGLNQLYGSPCATQDLLVLATQIGMDVSFFIYNSCCYATGRGEILEKITGPNLTVFLHTPPYSIPTRWAYKNLKTIPSSRGLTNEPPSLTILRTKLEAGIVTDWQQYVPNSFEELVFELHPDLRAVKELFLQHNVVATSLSGTGSTVFALVTDEAKQSLARTLRSAGIDFTIAKTLKKLGRRLVAGPRILDPVGEVRILPPQ